jgi:hypothetical protein
MKKNSLGREECVQGSVVKFSTIVTLDILDGQVKLVKSIMVEITKHSNSIGFES